MSTPPGNPPPAEVAVDADLVARLLQAQHPDLAALPLHLAATGWDNVTFRLGPELAVRMPRRLASAELIENEQAWLPEIAPHLPIPIPAPVRSGSPGAGFPWRWSIVPWVDGEQALTAPLHPGESGRLGGFLRTLHHLPVPAAAPHNPFRGVSLTERQPHVAARLSRLAAGGEHSALAEIAGRLFTTATEAPIDGSPAWLHGDLHGKNVISDRGRIAAIVDWGDVCAGDVATDLASAWMLFSAGSRDALWNAYGAVSAATVQRARGWAIYFGLMIWDAHHEADPLFARAGLETIRRAAE